MAEPILKLTRGIPRTDREWMDVFKNLTKFFRVSGDNLVIGGGITLPPASVGTDELEPQSVTDEILRHSQGNSVIGRSIGSAGTPTDIQAGADGHFLRRAGGVTGFGLIEDTDIPSTIARDTEVTAAIAAHAAASDPHPTYTTATELATAISNHEAASDPHPGYTTAAELASAISALNLASGTYTPTLTSVANLDATTAYSCQYLRVGSVVTVTGRLDANPTAAGTTTIGITLPIASNLANANECAGSTSSSEVAGQCAAIFGDSTNDRALMQWVAVDTSDRPMFFTFSYRII